MKPLPATFRRDGFDFRVAWREGDVALVEKAKPHFARLGWEVVLVQRHKAREIGGVRIEASEAMPPSESWGTLGWSFLDRESAEAKFRSLTGSQEGVAL